MTDKLKPNAVKIDEYSTLLAEIRILVSQKDDHLHAVVSRKIHTKNKLYHDTEYAKLIQQFINDVKKLKSYY